MDTVTTVTVRQWRSFNFPARPERTARSRFFSHAHSKAKAPMLRWAFWNEYRDRIELRRGPENQTNGAPLMVIRALVCLSRQCKLGKSYRMHPKCKFRERSRRKGPQSSRTHGRKRSYILLTHGGRHPSFNAPLKGRGDLPGIAEKGDGGTEYSQRADVSLRIYYLLLSLRFGVLPRTNPVGGERV
jgi:hypothetical protein